MGTDLLAHGGRGARSWAAGLRQCESCGEHFTDPDDVTLYDEMGTAECWECKEAFERQAMAEIHAELDAQRAQEATVAA